MEAGCIICDSGSVRLSVDGAICDVRQGDLFIYPPYSKIEIDRVDSLFECKICEVDYEFVLSAMKTISWSPKLKFISKVPVVSLSPVSAGRINELIQLILNRQDDEISQLNALSLDCLRKALAYEVLMAYMEKVELPDETRNSRDSIVVSFQEALKCDAVRFRDVRHYAQLQGLTPRYFSTAIRELTGYPPFYWICRAVIVEAQHLMLDTTLSLKEITYRLNFTSQTFFSRWYHQYSGETPSQFRKRNRMQKA
ncbi:MAG: helix-turn-helix domain-containing protein [Duncaniella sp.]|nr:helix-turn-helix domain-containing protein [Duncaniella sp.]